jgi:membrane protease YdiL (CAAX protease family)
LYLIYVTALSFQCTWVFKRTGGSLFAALILHTFTNITVVIFPPLVEGAFDKSTYWLAGFNLLIAIFLVTRPSFFNAAAKTAEPTQDRSPE